MRLDQVIPRPVMTEKSTIEREERYLVYRLRSDQSRPVSPPPAP